MQVAGWEGGLKARARKLVASAAPTAGTQPVYNLLLTSICFLIELPRASYFTLDLLRASPTARSHKTVAATRWSLAQTSRVSVARLSSLYICDHETKPCRCRFGPAAGTAAAAGSRPTTTCRRAAAAARLWPPL